MMVEHANIGDGIRGKRLVFEARRVGKVQVFSRSSTHRGSRGKLDDAICWIETPIDLPGRTE